MTGTLFDLPCRVLLVIFILFFAVACSEEETDPDSEVTVPTLTTLNVNNITSDSAKSGGNITDNGGAAVTSRGIVWGNSQNPTLDNNEGYTSDGSGSGMYESDMEGLTAETKYHVRAYATNSEGTAYGNNQEFETIVLAYSLVLESEPADAGSVSGDGDYALGEVVEIEAEPAEGWMFSGWTGDTDFVDDPGAATTNVTMPSQNISLVGNFVLQDDIVFGDGVTDIEGNEYVTVIIGNQEWMAHNLRTTKYNNGNDIPTDLTNEQWGSAWDGAYAIYDHEAENTFGIDSPEEMVEIYGLLYNRYAIEQENLCPEGWEVPSREDWEELVEYLINEHGYSNATNDQNGVGNALKVARQVNHPLGGGYDTNEHPRWDGNSIYYGMDRFGFSALPAGIRLNNGGYGNMGTYAYWWSSTEEDGSPMSSPFARLVDIQNNLISYSNIHDRSGISVRCIKED